MMTFTQRDRRIEVLRNAIATNDEVITDFEETIARVGAQVAEGAPPDMDEFALESTRGKLVERRARREILEAERGALTLDRFEVSDDNAAALVEDWMWRTTVGLRDFLAADLVIETFEASPLLTPEVAAVIEALPRGGRRPRPNFINEVSAAGGGGATLDQMTGIVLSDWLRRNRSERRAPFEEVGVLLPMRLETVFEEGDNGWVMLLRVIPDEPSILRDSPLVTAIDAQFLAEFWQGSAAMHSREGAIPMDWLLDPAGVVAWEALASRVTPQRAAWLVTSFPAHLVDGVFQASVPDNRIGERAPQRIGGLPPELVITIVDTYGNRFDVGYLAPNLPKEHLRVPHNFEALESWLVSWPKAKDVGMGGEFPLPNGITPETIATLYVRGIGDDDPTELFQAHVDAGQLGLVRLGAPTNTVQGAPAADLALDSESWRKIAINRLRGETGGGVAELARALCGDPSALPYIAGASHDIEDGRLMVATLWPALCGHHFRDIWGGIEQMPIFWYWATEFLRPEGPYLPIRIADQPYGILPVTSLSSWEASDSGELDQVEDQLLFELRRLLPRWAEAASARGTVVGATTEQLLDHLTHAGVSARYCYRSFIAAEQLAGAYSNVAAEFLERSSKSWDPTAEVLQQQPSRAYLATGHAAPLGLPLIGSDRLLPSDQSLRTVFEELYSLNSDMFASEFYSQHLKNIIPKSLLVRLMMQSVLLAKAWLVQSVIQPPNGMVLQNPLSWDDPEMLTQFEQLQSRFPSALDHADVKIRRMVEAHQEAIFRMAEELEQWLVRDVDPLVAVSEETVMHLRLPPEREAQLDRVLRATLDSAGHRIDPFATGIANRRLHNHSVGGRGRHRLGTYGWLDGPFGGKPGPTAARRLHAPSHAQVLTSVIMRDKFLSSAKELAAGDRNIWQMNLSSRTVRLAIEMADEVRMGFHIFEIVGRRVEGIVGRPDRVRLLRKVKPLRETAPDGRDTCHGLEALDALLADTVPGVLADDPAQRHSQYEDLQTLKAGLEAYSDLLVAEGVHQVVTGHADLAADAMDAAAGFGRPPSMEFARTPPSGYRLGTSVLTVLPHRVASDTPTPIELADASLAGFIDSRVGDVTRWSWRLESSVSGEPQAATVTLSELGLSPLETVLMTEDFLAEAVRSKTDLPSARVEGPTLHRLARQMAGTLGSPASLADVSQLSNVPDADQQAFEGALKTELVTRLGALQAVLEGIVDEVADGLTDAQCLLWLRKAVPWGVVGPGAGSATSPLAELLFGGRPPNPDELTGIVAGVRDSLKARLASAPDEPAKLSSASLALAIADLAAPGGKLTVTAQWSRTNLLLQSGIETGAEPSSLEADWLSITATVRPQLARLEALQLEAHLLGTVVPLEVRSNIPDDPWRNELVRLNADLRAAGELPKLDLRRLVVAFGAMQAWQAENVAVALIDQFTEAVPMAERSTYAAFGFNAPAARPPQTILLAVPPRSDRSLDPDVLLDILEETRELLRARAARPEDVGQYPATPTMWFDASSPLRLRLDNGTQYWR